ncbi:MAG: putative dipeptide transporter, periplasmic component [Chloroflexi bacterium]|nr:putative dipeptide transporter, periplasmic component [Chloroflexota bacterium]
MLGPAPVLRDSSSFSMKRFTDWGKRSLRVVAAARRKLRSCITRFSQPLTNAATSFLGSPNVCPRSTTVPGRSTPTAPFFGYLVARDLLSDRGGDVLALVSEVESLDASTVLVRWGTPYGFAGGLREELAPYPRRLLDDGAAGGPLLARSYWTSGYVGLGPFSVDRVSASQVDLRAFKDYFLGPPRLDGVTLKYATGPAVIVDALTVGEADVALAPSLRPADGIALRSGWEAEGRGSVLVFPRASLVAAFQLSEPGLGSSTLGDPGVRRGLIAALNRQQTAFAESLGLLQAPTGWWPQTSGPAAGSQASDNDLAYNPRRAFELFAEAGWNRSADGKLVSGGDRQLRIGLSSASAIAAADVIVRYWREIGAEVGHPGPLGSVAGFIDVSLRETEVGAEGLQHLGPGGRGGTSDPLGTGWPNLEADILIHRLRSALRVEERLRLDRELVGIVDREAPALPVAFLPMLLPVAEGVSGPLPRSGYRVRPWLAFNAHEWAVT